MYLASFAFSLPLSLIGVPIFIALLIMPVVFFFLFKRKILKTPSLKKWEKFVLTILVLIAYLWIAARIGARFIPGGGAGYVVSVYARVTIIPAIWGVLFVDLFVLARNYQKKWVLGAIITGVALFAIVVGIRSWNWYYYKTVAWNEYCQNAGDKFFYDGMPVKHLEIHDLGFSRVYEFTNQNERTGRSHNEKPAEELLKRGVIKEYTQIWKRSPNKPELVKLINGKVKAEVVGTLPEATHKISRIRDHMIVSGGRSYDKYTTTVKNLKTGKVIARRIIYERASYSPQACGDIYNNQLSLTDFLQAVIVNSGSEARK